MNKILMNSLLTTLAIGLMSGSAMAHEQQYDNTKEPHETAHKAEPPKGGHESLAAAATNPIANLIQFQIQDAYSPDNYNADSYSNVFILQPVIPIKLSSESVPLLVTRTTLPYVSTPDLDGVGRKQGFGDLTTLGIFVPKSDTKGVMYGFGYNLTVPTAGDNEFVGSGKWSIGPSAVYFNGQTKGWQWGIFSYSSFSFAAEDSSREHVSNIAIQPFVVRHFDGGWYVGSPDNPQTYDFRTDNWTTQIGPRVGRVMKFGAQPVNLAASVYYNTEDNDDEISSEWTYKLNLTFLFPA